MGRRGAVSARAKLLHAAAGTRGPAARDLYRLADAPLAGCDHRGWAVRRAWHHLDPGIELRLRRLRQCPGGRRSVLWPEGSGTGDRVAGGASGRQPRLEKPGDDRARGAGVHRHLLFQRAVSVDRHRRWDHRFCRRPLWVQRVSGRRRARLRCREGRPRRQPARRCAATARPAHGWSRSTGVSDLAGALAGPRHRDVRGARQRQRLYRHRRVLFQDGRCHLRRRLCGARLYGAAGGRDLWMAAARRDAGRARHGRDHPRAADHGGAVRRLPRGLPPPRDFAADARRDAGRPVRDVVHVCAVLSVDRAWCPVHREIARQQAAQRRTRRHHRRRGRRDPQPRDLVCPSHLVPRARTTSTGSVFHSICRL